MKTKIFLIRSAIFAIFSAGVNLLAQNPAAADKLPSPTLAEMLAKGGILMPLLYLLSFAAVCLIFYYFFSLRTELIAPLDFIRQAEDAIKRKDIDLLEQICGKDNSPLAKTVGAAVEAIKKPNCSYTIMKDAMEDEGSRQGSILWQRIQYLSDIAVIAPMVGLLGTVFGMIVSFGALHTENITPKPTIIANGVAMALITTAAGLVIAIPSMLIHAYFRGRVIHLITELEAKCGKISRELMEAR